MPVCFKNSRRFIALSFAANEFPATETQKPKIFFDGAAKNRRDSIID